MCQHRSHDKRACSTASHALIRTQSAIGVTTTNMSTSPQEASIVIIKRHELLFLSIAREKVFNKINEGFVAHQQADITACAPSKCTQGIAISHDNNNNTFQLMMS